MFKKSIAKLALLSSMFCLMFVAASSLQAQNTPPTDACMIIKGSGMSATFDVNCSAWNTTCDFAFYYIGAIHQTTGQWVNIQGNGQLATNNSAGDGGKVTHTFAVPGVYTVYFSLQDCTGGDFLQTQVTVF